MTTYELLDLLGNTWVTFRCRHCGESFRDSVQSLEHYPYNRSCPACGKELPLTSLIPLVTSIRNCLTDWSLEITEEPASPSNGGKAREQELSHA